MKPEPFIGWGIRIAGSRPYLLSCVYYDKESARHLCEEKSDRVVRVALIPLAEYRRLRRIAKRVEEEAKEI